MRSKKLKFCVLHLMHVLNQTLKSYDTCFKMNICTYVVPISNLVFILMYCLYNLQRSLHRSCGRVKLPHSFVAMERGKVSMSKMTQPDDQILWSIKPWWTHKIFQSSTNFHEVVGVYIAYFLQECRFSSSLLFFLSV